MSLESPPFSQQKMEQELERGRQGLIRSLRRALKQQFGDAPADLMEQLSGLPSVPLEKLAETVYNMKSLAEVQNFVTEASKQ